ncbi:M23 family metallopeptidase [Litorisediminicola beolgyonensis]|uniref:M23 family metallopeptidase n=1 Tax=Litorisediminicola beolgyonensis TaxID=1173614 RepID=A0ABW3ZLY4_9RHOB
MIRALAALTLLTSAAPVAAEVPFLDWPVDCTLGETCFIEDYPDTVPGEGALDHACGPKTRDGHNGTDIALMSFAQLEAGITVRAAAPGIVAAMRDGMEDRPVSPANAAEIKGRECGNAVRITHETGFETLYCHLKRGSVRVTTGMPVEAGTPLGQIGMSGESNFPHLHLTLLRDGSAVDPFAPDAATCANASAPLWIDTPGYDRAGLFTAGFSDRSPTLDGVATGSARVTRVPPDAALVLYGFAFHVEDGDLIALVVEGPGGPLFSQDVPIADGQTRLFRAFGRAAPPQGWAPGDYRGTVTLSRDGRVLARRFADVTVD